MSRSFLWVAVLGIGLNACGDDEPPLCEVEGGQVETPSGATCDGSTLTYENFGEAFMTNYCTTCHSSSLQGEEERNCAPSDHNFDTLDEIILYREHIDEHAAAGPEALNDAMPPSGQKPTEQERRDLGTWLACLEEQMP